MAVTKDIGEIVIAFGNYLLRGTRARKIEEEGYDAFDTPGIESIGKRTSLSESIKLFDHRTRRGAFDPRIFTDFDTKIFHYAHISGATIDDYLMESARREDIHGILLGGFGAGNIPDRLISLISEARDNKKTVFVYTNCDTGATDMGIYSVGAAPLDAGAKPAGDMTLQALGQKIMYAIGRTITDGLTGDEKLDFVETIIRKPYNGDIIVTDRRK